MPDDPTDGFSTGWVLGGIGTIIATLASIVAMLYKVRESENAKRIEAMEKEHTATKAELSVVKQDIKVCTEDRIALHRSDAASKERITILEDMLKEIHPNWKSKHERST